MLDARLVEILACPKCKAALTDTGADLCCVHCGLTFEVIGDIPILIESKARKPEAANE